MDWMPPVELAPLLNTIRHEMEPLGEDFFNRMPLPWALCAPSECTAGELRPLAWHFFLRWTMNFVNIEMPVYPNASVQLQLLAKPASAVRAEPITSPTCALYPGKRIVMVTVTGKYLAMFENWHHHAKRFFTETEQLVAIAEDEAAAEHLRSLALASTPPFKVIGSEVSAALYASDTAKVLPQAAPEYKASQGDPEVRTHREVLSRKPRHLLMFLKQNCTVLYSDVDMVWLKDPFVEISAFSGRELLLTNDDCSIVVLLLQLLYLRTAHACCHRFGAGMVGADCPAARGWAGYTR